MTTSTKILDLAHRLAKIGQESPTKELKALSDAATNLGKAWSGSWFGYHSRVYYENLVPVPTGAYFSMADGLQRSFSSETIGNWIEYKFDDLIYDIKQTAGVTDLQPLVNKSKEVAEIFEGIRFELLSLLTPIANKYKEDTVIENIIDTIKKQKIPSYRDYLTVVKPKGQFISRDNNAIQAGLEIPAHYSILANVFEIQVSYEACTNLGKNAQRVVSHLENLAYEKDSSKQIGTRVFIGHGRSPVWKNLKDFIQDRLNLQWDEFNRVSVAGHTNINRLSSMLDNAAIAFIIMTAEDEQADQTLHARMNVIHEAGLFQGRLGFEKAILLLEDGCKEFSNVQGLGQIRFPKGNIEAKFEEIRLVLEREKLIE
jgi:predicted nucleotide-binding protein